MMKVGFDFFGLGEVERVGGVALGQAVRESMGLGGSVVRWGECEGRAQMGPGGKKSGGAL